MYQFNIYSLLMLLVCLLMINRVNAVGYQLQCLDDDDNLLATDGCYSEAVCIYKMTYNKGCKDYPSARCVKRSFESPDPYIVGLEMVLYLTELEKLEYPEQGCTRFINQKVILVGKKLSRIIPNIGYNCHICTLLDWALSIMVMLVFLAKIFQFYETHFMKYNHNRTLKSKFENINQLLIGYQQSHHCSEIYETVLSMKNNKAPDYREFIVGFTNELYAKIVEINRNKSLGISLDTDEDYEDNIYYLMLNVFLDERSSKSSDPFILGLSLSYPYYANHIQIFLYSWQLVNNCKISPGDHKGVDVEMIRQGIYSDTDAYASTSNGVTFAE
ncbi:hypothetical protein BCR32DRAFT_282807 [Anaeromyces robustus]|uniref:Man1/Src1 C-terminal domain-containing protein n=1 Tax=Anaeromyces robustus TaxID=1754192 RepID=A0A1Y1WWK0_9FUNG|nr:hypothetical protein BCR32DRAFT_282807 [Anaeromyces robustus]|eukprot:ORX77883.1 hypothetical protein BCR32DRAFT_282807 [Anaeromyces robustus]